MHRSGDGDIVVPQRALSVVGTSSWIVEDPDELDVPEDHVARMRRGGSKLIPAVAQRRVPGGVVGRAPADRLAMEADSGRELSRTFKTIDHAAEDGVEGFVTITGGKATTLRGMAELCADVVCRKLGVDRRSTTRDTVTTLPTPPSTRRPSGDWRERPDPNGPSRDSGRSASTATSAATRGGGSTASRCRSDARTTVLEALRWIKLHRDRTLALRHSCLHASCGTCGMQRERPRGPRVRDARRHPRFDDATVEPLANIPVLTDLVVDMRQLVRTVPG